ncbi:MAG: hypothetical protein VB048_09120, partial [Bacteroidaceae bacterium]|nr:hypothetical protein [Bacteroidaceae bacterium]
AVAFSHHFKNGCNLAWFLGILYIVAIIFFSKITSFLLGFYILAIFYILVASIYTFINVLIDSLIIRIITKEEKERREKEENEKEA